MTACEVTCRDEEATTGAESVSRREDGVGGEHSVVEGGVLLRARHERGEAGEEGARRQLDVGGGVLPAM
jgi:hypothetical protein